MTASASNQDKRPIERVLQRKRVQEYLEANRIRVFPPMSGDAWNYWHAMRDGGVRPISADQLLLEAHNWKREHYVSEAEEASAQHLYPLTAELRREIERLQQIFSAHGRAWVPNKGAPKARLRRTEEEIGYHLDSNLCAFYALTDGGPLGNGWFAIGIENPRQVDFLSLDESLDQWRRFASDEAVKREPFEQEGEAGEFLKDTRIGSVSIYPAKWWNFAGSDYPQLFLDYCPSASGKVGQVIVYYHDPDELLWIADDFVSFFRRSNDLLESRWEEIVLDD